MARTGLISAALRRVRPSVLLPLIGGNLVVLLAVILALKIPDSHSWQVLLSALLGLGIVSAVLLWNAIALRRMRTPHSPTPLWSGALLLAIWFVLAALLFQVATLANANIEARAGFWNFRLSPALRHLLTYSRLITLQHMVVTAFTSIVVAGLLVPFAIETATYGPRGQALSRALKVLFSIRHWITAAVALGIASWLLPVLIDWHPTHTVTGELISALLRLSLAAVLAVCVVIALLAVDAELLARRDSASQARAGS